VNPEMDRSINDVSQTVTAANKWKHEQVDPEFQELKDTVISDECDEKRSYTPQPRQMKMIGGIPSKTSHPNLINRSQLTTPGQNLNKSSMSKFS
jgi:hypothetical protein